MVIPMKQVQVPFEPKMGSEDRMLLPGPERNQQDEKVDTEMTSSEFSDTVKELLKSVDVPNCIGRKDWKLSVEPLVNLLSNKSHREAALRAIRSDKFHKNHARRLFSPLIPILDSIVDSEAFLPHTVPTDTEMDECVTATTCTAVDCVGVNASQVPQFRDGSNRANRGNTRNRDPDTQRSGDDDSVVLLLFMKYTASMVQAYLDNLVSRRTAPNESQTTDIPKKKKSFSFPQPILQDVTHVAETLHDSLLALNYCRSQTGISTQRTIMTMCENYWNRDFVDRPILTTQLIPLLLMKASTQSDLKRLWNLRGALRLLDFSQPESISYLSSQLLLTVSSPLYCKCVEGRKLIAFLFTLHQTLAQRLHQAIRAQIPMANKSTLQYYGDVYLRAWKMSLPQYYTTDDDSVTTLTSSHGLLDDEDSADNIPPNVIIEEHILSDIVYSSLHVASPTVAKNIRILLQPIFENKKDSHIENLLFRLYGPILWRGLSAANPIVRIHSCHIFALTFPLHPSHVINHQDNGSKHSSPINNSKSKENVQHVVTKSVTVLQQLLTDSCPKVRISASETTTCILAAYWDMIPPRDIRQLLQIILTQHANDASSSAVRAHAIHVISFLLDATLASHAVLRPLLPSLGNMIHDKNERVRLKSVHLLIKIKALEGDIKFYHVVPYHHLMARLEAEGTNGSSNTVARALTKLLLSSYFPQGAKGSEQLDRTLIFLARNPNAARVFYSNLVHVYPTNVIAKLIALLLKALKIAVDRHNESLANQSHEILDASELENHQKEKKAGRKRSVSAVSEKGSMNSSNRIDPVECEIHNHNCEEVRCSTTIIASNTSLMARIAETICILWESIDSDLVRPKGKDSVDFLNSALSNAGIINILLHFEKLAYTFKNESSVECANICSSILRCARRIVSPDVEAISSHITSRVSLFEPTNNQEPTTVPISSHVALLCAWGLQDDVISSLSRSITPLTGSRYSDELEYYRNQNIDDSASDRDNGMKIGNKRTLSIDPSQILPCRNLSAFTVKNILPPNISCNMALTILSDILCARDSNCLAARSAVLSSDCLSQSMEKLLDEVSGQLESFPSFELRTANQLNSMLMVFETYLRLLLHKQLLQCEPRNLCPQVVKWLSWITDRLLPTLTDTKVPSCGAMVASPFQILNISGISGATDVSIRISLSPELLISSPLSKLPPSKRARETPNGNSRPRSLSLKTYANHASTRCIIKTFAFSLVNSVVCILSDWLTIGGSESHEIQKYCQDLIRAFEIREILTVYTKRALGPGLRRLAQLLSDSTLQKDLIKQF